MAIWDGKNRRTFIRREEDKQVCPFHKIKCDAIQNNKDNIHGIEEKMATKEDLKNLSDDVKSKAPRWVLIMLVLIVTGLFSYIALQIRPIHTIEANQKILMNALRIDVHPKDFDKEHK